MQVGRWSIGASLIAIVALVALIFGMPDVARSSGATQGVTGKEVTLGAWAPETGQATALYATGQGASAYFQWLNDHGGIGGYRFKFVLVNDQYNPALTPAAARRLVAVDRVFAIVAGVGTPSNVAVLSYLSDVGIPNIAPASGDPTLTRPVRKNIFTVVPSYINEGAFQANFALNHLHAKSIAVIYQNDDIGKTGLEGVKKMLAQHHLNPATAVPFDPGTLSFAPYLVRLKASGADTVIIWGSHPAFAPILKAAATIGYRPTWLAFGFDADPNVVSQVPQDQLANANFDTWMPNPDEPSMADYRAAMRKYYPHAGLGLLSVQGWCLASVFATAFSKMVEHGAQPTLQGLEQAMESLKHVSNRYVHDLTYTSTDHQGLPAVYVMQFKNEKIVKVTPYLSLPKM